MDNEELDQILQEGIAAARAGKRERAHDLLLRVIALDEEVEAAWLWLSGVVDDREEKQICLENVLALNPNNDAAQAGLRWLAQHGQVSPPDLPRSPQLQAQEALYPEPSPVPAAMPSPEPQPPPESLPSSTPSPTVIEIAPYGCPYCGGSVSSGEPRCDRCRRLVVLRQRKRAGNMGIGWLVLFFVLQGATAGLEAFFVRQLVEIGQLPAWLTQTAMSFTVGPALLGPEGIPGELEALAETVILINLVLGGLCLVAAVGLAFRSRAAYFGSFLLDGLLVIAAGVGLLTQLSGWLPALFLVGLAVISIKWLIDSAPAFEWKTRQYNSDVDQDLKNDLDYYSRGQRYREMGMWAKAAAHWKVAVQLAPSQVKYSAALASAYARMGYPSAALAEADRALSRAPDDEELRRFRNSLAALEDSS